MSIETERVTTFDFGDLRGEAHPDEGPVCEERLRRACDPASARESIHWGRNYLYVTDWRRSGTDGVGAASLPVVVKQFRNDSLKARVRRRIRGTKASRAFHTARLLEELGIGTPRPVLYADSRDPDGPAFFVSEHLDGLLEARYLLRSLHTGSVDEDYPDLDPGAVFRAFGRLCRRLHDGGVWHRDLTCGNLLIDESRFVRGAAPGDSIDGLWLLDLNRARTGRPVSLPRRMRDLGRLEVPREQMAALWEGYWYRDDGALRRGAGRCLRQLSLRSFLLKNRSKKGARSLGRRLGDALLPRRRPHAHIPASEETSLREKIVWDHLSDQPHQHASKWEKLRVRVVDAPEHVAFLGAAAIAAPRIRRRLRELEAVRFTESVSMEGFGVCVRPWRDDPGAPARAVADLGVRHVLLRLEPWRGDHGPELDLARELAGLGVELAFSLPQDRSLVRDLDLWRRRVVGLAEAFAPLGMAFQIGQAPNRSKWGVWKPSEYAQLWRAASEELRRVRPDVQLLGPAVIDFELHQTAGYIHRRFDGEPLDFDGLASLLYVDRRGAPENAQMGLDTVGKTASLRAIADTAPGSEDRRLPNWVTEVNWPLWEGPHSPAGRDVAVDEETQAHYLARYFLSVLAAGHVERVYWWQVIAKGYGLVDWNEGPDGQVELRRRPSFTALATLVRELAGATFTGTVGTAGADQWLLRFQRPAPGGEGEEEIVAGWSSAAASTVEFPGEVAGVCGLDGGWREGGGRRARLDGAVRLFRLA